MDKTIYDMNVPELQTQIQQKEIEYRKAIETKKVFWEVKKILKQKREIEKELAKRGVATN